jgi:glycosyl hydrolase family 113
VHPPLRDRYLDSLSPKTGNPTAGRGRNQARKALWLLGLGLVLGANPGLAGRLEGIGPFQKGMVLGIFSKTDPEYFKANLEEIKRLGVDSISLIVPKVQKSVGSVGFHDDPWITPSEASLRLAIREAHRLGMRVFLMPIVYLEDLKDGEWRGTIKPASWEAWFDAYEAMITRYAKLGAEERVEYFSVGSELCSTEKKRERWARIIRKVRDIYPGLITYSANWDHLEEVSFGRDLDFLGMNAYYEIGKGSDSSPAAMATRWRDIQGNIRSWRKANGDKPIVITEVGYPSRTGAGVDPWNYFGEGQPDLEEQRKCYEAFVQAWNGEKMLAGVYFYLWWGDGGSRDRDYTPRGKPAQDVIQAWFSGTAKKGGAPDPPGVMP